MRNIAFVVWMLGWPLSRTIQNYVEILTKTEPPQPDFGGALLLFAIWIIVGVLLYEKPNRT